VNPKHQSSAVVLNTAASLTPLLPEFLAKKRRVAARHLLNLNQTGIKTMKRSEKYPSKYLKASDFPQPEVVTIKRVYQDTIGNPPKPADLMEFAEKDKPCVVNKTNGNFCYDYLADDDDDWPGKQVLIETPLVTFQGKSVPAIRFNLPLEADMTQDAPF
jgi:hypothetical protein